MAGKPHDPTLHPRTRQEANEYATKNRGTGDWFRHDGKNLEPPPPGAVRMGDKRGDEIAEKSKGQPDEWFQHDHSNPSDPAPAGRTHTEEGKHYQEKIYGKEEKWSQAEENKDYYSPKGQTRLPDHGPSKDLKKQFTRPDTNNWYKHNEKKSGDASPQPKSPDVAAAPFAVGDPCGAADVKAANRMTNPEAEEYLQRNVHGSASDWFGHDKSSAPAPCQSPRGTSGEGGKIKEKLGRESENWFDYDANKGYNNPMPATKGANAATRDMVEKSRGGQMDQVMSREKSEQDTSPNPRIKPEAREVAEKNRQGLMDKYLQSNKDYESARPEPRIKPEANDNAEKNKGIMSDCLQGYPDPPVQHDVQRIKPEAEAIAKKNQGTANLVMAGEAPPSNRGNASRAVKSEAMVNADRNKGSLGGLLGGYENMEISSRPTPRGQSDSARQNAIRNQGSLGGVLGFKA